MKGSMSASSTDLPRISDEISTDAVVSGEMPLSLTMSARISATM